MSDCTCNHIVTRGRPVGLVLLWPRRSSSILAAPQHTGNFFLNKECKFGQVCSWFIQLFLTFELIIVYPKYIYPFGSD